MYIPNGEPYHGAFQDGIMHGHGIYTYVFCNDNHLEHNDSEPLDYYHLFNLQKNEPS